MNEPQKEFYFHRASGIRSNQSTQHYHSTFEIYYMKEGRCHYFIDDKSYEVRSGDLILIPDGVIHKTGYYSDTYTRLLVNCSYDYIPREVVEALPKETYLYRDPEIAREAEQILSHIEAEYRTADAFSDHAFRCYTGALFQLLLRSKIRTPSDGDDSPIRRVVKFVRENYTSRLLLSDVAKHFSFTPEHLSRAFKKETGFGFCEYLTLLRLRKAEFMLRNEPGRAICEVAYACGFNDSNYFSDKFKKTYGVPPSAIRKQGAMRAPMGGAADANG